MSEHIIFWRSDKEIKFSYVHAAEDLALATKQRLANLVGVTEEQIISVYKRIA